MGRKTRTEITMETNQVMVILRPRGFVRASSSPRAFSCKSTFSGTASPRTPNRDSPIRNARSRMKDAKSCAAC